MPGTLGVKNLGVFAQMTINVMDEELVNLDGAKGLIDQPRMKTIDTMKL